MSEWLESQQAQTSALELLANEAYFAVDVDSPLSVDPSANNFREQVATCLDAWPYPDYASGRDSDREEYAF